MVTLSNCLLNIYIDTRAPGLSLVLNREPSFRNRQQATQRCKTDWSAWTNNILNAFSKWDSFINHRFLPSSGNGMEDEAGRMWEAKAKGWQGAWWNSCCLLAVIWLSWTHSCCGYLYTTCAWTRQPKFRPLLRRYWHLASPGEGIVISLLSMLLLISFLWSSEMTPYPSTYGWQSLHKTAYQK